MTHDRFSQLVRRWVHRVRRPEQRGLARTAKNFVRLAVSECEARIAPAALPAPIVTDTRVVIGDPSPAGDFRFNGTQAAQHPADPYRMVFASSREDGIEVQFSQDGGVNWTSILSSDFGGLLFDPLVQNQRYTNVSSPSVAIARNGDIYAVHLEHNAAKTSGAVVVNSWSWAAAAGADPVRLANNTVVYRWAGNDPAYNPVIGVPTAGPGYTDPEDATVTITNPLVYADGRPKAAYVAWSTKATQPSAPDFPRPSPDVFNPHAILTASSQDRGATFSSPLFVNRRGYWGDNVNEKAKNSFAPRLAFGPTGQLTFAWESFNPNTLDTFLRQPNNPNTPQPELVLDTSFPAGKPGAPAKAQAVFNKRFVDNNLLFGTTQTINDGTKNDPNPHIPGVTTSTISIPVGGFTPDFNTLTDFDIGIAFTHNKLEHVRVEVIDPDGNTITLVRNRLDNAGTATTPNPNVDPFPPGFTFGLDGVSGLGAVPGIEVAGFTVFDDNAPRLIHDPEAVSKANAYIGHFRPEAGSLAKYHNKAAALLDGNWTLRITDNRQGPPDTGPINPRQVLLGWYLNFTSHQLNDNFGRQTKDGFNNDKEAAVSSPQPTPASGQKGGVYNLKGAPDGITHPFTPGFSPTVGIGPSIAIAYDNSVGPFSRGGNLYVAWTAVDKSEAGNGNPANTALDTEIRLGVFDGTNFSLTSLRTKPSGQMPAVSIVNDDNPADHFSEGIRPQFLPSVVVDPATGYVTVMWYDARTDASASRAAVFLATSMDGGASFSPQVSVSEPKVARNTITNETVVLEPTPSNLAAAGSIGFGVHPASVLAFGGKITPIWTGNYNDDKNFVFTSTVRVPAGPQVLGSDMGPVTDKVVVPDPNDPANPPVLIFNDDFAPDGTRLLDGFRVTFDRPIDPRTFGKDDIEVKFRGPYDNAFSGVVAVEKVFPLDGLDKNKRTLSGQPVFTDATTFFVQFTTPQKNVGTYSYTVGPDIRDFNRNIDGYRLLLPTPGLAAPFKFADGRTIPDPTVNPILGDLDPGVLQSTRTITAGPGLTVGDVAVDVNIDHNNVGDLNLYLIAPGGAKVTLSTRNGGGGDNYVKTRFDGASLVGINAGSAPFTGTFRPTGQRDPFRILNVPPLTRVPDRRPTPPLGSLAGASVNGDWTLYIEDAAKNQVTGVLRDWSLSIIPGEKNTAANPSLGNPLDQDGDGRPQETAGLFPTSNDVYAVPRPTSGTPYQLPYVGTTLPLIIPGPRVRPDTLSDLAQGIDNVTVTGQDANSKQHSKLSNLVLNADAKTIDITFDRDMYVPTVPTEAGAATTFGADDIVRVIGPFGVVYDAAKQANPGITVTPVYTGAPAAGTPTRTFRVTFPDALAATFISGQYGVEIGSNIKSANGDLLDTNMNAGLYRLAGGDPFARPLTLADTATYTFGTATPLRQFGTLSVPITITDDYVIRQTTGRNKTDPHILVRMSVQHPEPQALSAELVSPDGFRIRLFTGIGDPTSTLLTGFTGVFDDNAPTPIQFLATEFPTEPVTPQFPLSVLAGRTSKGEWRLELTDNSSKAGTRQLNNWGLTFPFANPVENGAFQGTTPPPLPGVPPVSKVNVSAQPNGLGEPIADRFTIGFRVFNQDPLDDRTRQVWVPVGPTTMNGQTSQTNNAGRVSAAAVDPSDPSGNTVYIGAGTGGVWKTTNFLTTASAGPTWLPLTDFGAVQGMAVSSIVLVPRNGDPNQTAVYALTGDGSKIGTNAPFVSSPNPGVGVLRSSDAGRTWQVLDSTKNSTAATADATGTILPIDSPTRDRLFFGAEGFKIVADPRPTPQGNILLYMAVGGNNANSRGVWRSRNGGDTWTRIEDRGPASDVILVPATAGSNGNGNLERLYAAITGLGVFTTTQAANTPLGGLTQLNGGQGNQLIRDVSFPPGTPGREVTVNAPTDTPNGPTKGRITLALPALTDSPLQNTLYAGWLYALASTPQGTLSGLFVTKDFGANWTEVRLPWIPDTPDAQAAFATNDETTQNDYDPFNPRPLPNAFPNPTGLPRQAQGNYNLSLAVDPQDPNVLFIGGLGSTNGRPQPLGGSLRVDVTKVNDPHAFVFWDHSAANAVNVQRLATVGGAAGAKDETLRPPPPPYPVARTEGALYRPNPDPNTNDFYFGTYPDNYADFLNLYRDPDNPFLTPDTLRVFNTQNFTNNGQNAEYRPFTALLGSDLQAGANDIHEIVPFTDPLTGRPRYIYATDHGVFTGVADDKGDLIRNVGFAPSVTYSRNGNLQLAQFTAGAVQPSQLAADIAGALFYGTSRDNGYPVSTRDVLRTGDTNWNNPLENPPGSTETGRFDPTGTAVAVDPTGSGTAFEYRWPGTSGPGIQLPTDFFRVFQPNTNHSGQGTSQTKGLLQAGDDPGNDAGQWPLGDERPVGNFAVNTYDAKGLVIGSGSGQVFRTTNQGTNWFSIGFPQAGSISRAFAFGAPATPTSELNNFVFAGTEGGQVFITYDKNTDAFTGTFVGSPSNISAGITDGTPVMRIVPNPGLNSREAYAITQKAVYYSKDVVAIAEGTAQWANVTGNLFTVTRAVFGEAGATVVPTNALRTINALVVDWRVRTESDPANPAGPDFAPLYVAGDGGVFQSLDNGTKWAFYPDNPADGVNGSLADVGFLPNVNITDLDLSVGPFDPQTGKFQSENSLNLLVATTYGRGTYSIRLPLDRQSGPRILSLFEDTAVSPSGPVSKIGVTFNQAIDGRTFTEADVKLTAPDSSPVAVTKVEAKPNVPGPGQPDLQNQFWVYFGTPQSSPGFYNLVIGPDIRDISGEFMNQDQDLFNGEDPFNPTNPRLDDRFVRNVFFNGVADSLVLTGLPTQVTAGVSQSVTVTATDRLGNTIPTYGGTVSIASTDATATSGGASFPVTFTFVPADSGSRTIEVTFRKAGLPFAVQSLTATQTTGGGAINPGKIDTKVVAADASRILVDGFPGTVIAGDTKQFFVTAFDPFDNIADKYRGTVAFSTSDPSTKAKVPNPYTFVAADAGKRQFDAKLVTAGLQSITAKDVANNFTSTQGNILVVNAPADKLFLSDLAGTVKAGQQGVTFKVTAKDVFGNVAKDYDNLVTFTTNDAQAVTNPPEVPERLFNGTTFDFNPANQGIAVVGIEFRTAGTKSVTVTAPTPVAGDTISTLVVPEVASSLAVFGFTPNPVVSGDTGTFTVEARDRFGNTATGYAGKVRFDSSDPNRTLPADYMFVGGDQGKRQFAAVLKTVGTQSITVTDTANPSITGSQNDIVVGQSFAKSFELTGLPLEVTAGEDKSFTVTVRDAKGQVSFGYIGTVNIVSTDGQAVLDARGNPVQYTFRPTDYGVRTFPVQFRTAGGQSITVSEPGGTATPGVISTTVLPAAADRLAVAGFPSPVIAGDTKTFLVTARDKFGNVATKYGGTIRFGSSDPLAALPDDGKLINGIGTFVAALKTAGLQSISATDVDPAAPNLTGSQVGIRVDPASASQVFISNLPAQVAAGSQFGFTVTLKDVFGNLATTFTGDVQFSSTDPQGVLPPTYTFTTADAGVKAFTGAELRTAGPRNLTVSSPVPGLNPGTGSIVVIPGAATLFTVTPLPAVLNAGDSASFTVTAKDKFGNTATGYTGTVAFGSSDPRAILPGPFSFTATDAGVKAFGVTLFTSGDQTVTIRTPDGSIPAVDLRTTVRPSVTTRFEVTGGPTTPTAGQPVTVTITARDQFGNIDTNYAGMVRFRATDGRATVPGDSNLTAGVGTFTVVFRTAGPQSVTAAATSDAALTGKVDVTVFAAPVARFELTGPTGAVSAGSAIPVDVTARDQFGNVVTTYAGTVRFTSTDAQATLPGNATLVGGTGRFSVVLRTAGSQVVTAADADNPGVSGSLTGLTVILPPPPPNAPPTITDIPNKSVRLNQPTGPLGFTIGDTISPPAELTVTVTSSDPGLIPPAGIVLSGSGADRTVTVTPAIGRSGTAVITVTVTDPGGLTATDSFALTVQPTTGPRPAVLIGADQFAVGTDVGGAPVARLFNPDGTERISFTAFPDDGAFTGGVRVAAADFTGDGIADVVVGTGLGVTTLVRVLDGRTQAELFSITPFESGFVGGVFVAAGDLNGDGLADLVITPDEGGGPRVQVFDGVGFGRIANFFGPGGEEFRGGARAAVGDISGDGVGDLVVAAGFLGGPRVAAYDGRSLPSGLPLRLFNDLFVFEETLRNGAYVAVGDLDGDGFAELIAGGGPTGGPRVRAFSGKALLGNGQVQLANFFGGDEDNRSGIRVAVKDLDDDTRADLVVGPGLGGGTLVTTYFGKDIGPAGTPRVAFDFDAFTRFNGGVFVG